MAKQIAIYGAFEVKVPVKQRYWKRRKDGVKQRYWKKTTRTKTVVKTGRYEFSGKGLNLYKAIGKAYRIVPKGFQTVEAVEFLEDPFKYGEEGEWIDREIKS